MLFYCTRFTPVQKPAQILVVKYFVVSTSLIAAVSNMLKETKYPVTGKRVVWALNDRVYRSGTDFYTIPKEEWEASPYANVHKYNHDVYPANAAIGMNGCTDCHAPKSPFFFAQVLKYPFDEKAAPLTMPQYHILGISDLQAFAGAYRETYLKPILYFLLLIVACLLVGWVYQRLVEKKQALLPALLVKNWVPLAIAGAAFIGVIIILMQPELKQYALPSRFWLDANHFFISALILGGAFIFALQQNQKNFRWLLALLLVAIVAGIFMLVKLPFIGLMTRLSYSIFDLSRILLALSIFLLLIRRFIVKSA